MASNNVKKRNWTFLVYLDSAPRDWREVLRQTGLLCAISPLHDKDLDPTGDTKKPHYHVIACYSGPTSYNVVKGLTEALCAPIPQALEQVRGMYRYFTHKDNPEKYQYDESEITTINGFSIMDFVELTKSEVLSIKRELQSLIRDSDITEYSDFMDILQDSENADQQYDVAASNTFFFEKYISSRRNKRVIKDRK